MDRVIIHELEDGTHGIYNEAGQLIEGDFASYFEAVKWANDNGLQVPAGSSPDVSWYNPHSIVDFLFSTFDPASVADALAQHGFGQVDPK